jgi:DNA-binding MarR family transcriptional regulator
MDFGDEALLAMMVATYCIRDRFAATLTQDGLSLGQYNVLRILRGAGEEGRTRGEISDRLVERSPDVTRLVDRLVGMGLVRRARNRTDRRCSAAYITPEGLALLDRIDPVMERIMAEIKGLLSPSELATLGAICERLIPAESDEPGTQTCGTGAE